MSPHSARLFEQGQRNYKKREVSRYFQAILSPTIPSTGFIDFQPSCGRASPLDWLIFLGTTHKHTNRLLETVILNLFPIKSRMSQPNVVFDFGKCFSRRPGSAREVGLELKFVPRVRKAPWRGIICYACVRRVHGKFSFFLPSTCTPTQSEKVFPIDGVRCMTFTRRHSRNFWRNRGKTFVIVRNKPSKCPEGLWSGRDEFVINESTFFWSPTRLNKRKY